MVLLLTTYAAKPVALIQHICRQLRNQKTLKEVCTYKHVALAHIVLMVTNTPPLILCVLQAGADVFVWLAAANSKICAQLFRRFAAAMPIKYRQLITPPRAHTRTFTCHLIVLRNALNNALITTSALSVILNPVQTKRISIRVRG
jgi:hypothetical protein